MGIYTTMYLGPGDLGGPDTTARNGWSGLRRSKVFKGEPWRGGGSPSKTGTLPTEKFSTLRTAVASKHNIDFEGVAGAIKFAEFMKRKAERCADAENRSKNLFATSKRKNKINMKYMGSHMTYSGTDYGSQTYRKAREGFEGCLECNLEETGVRQGTRPRSSRIVVEGGPSCRSPSAEELQKTYGLTNEEGKSVAFEEGRGGLTKVVLNHACGSSAEVYLYGACVTSWKQASGDEVLYVRPDAKFDRTKAISGGIPICFPQFGPGEMKQHGFARDSVWSVASTSADYNPDDRDPNVELVLEDSEGTRECGFPHAFRVSYSITLHRETLQTDFRVINTGDSAFEFTAALHSYFEVAGVENASISGLGGLTYLNKVPDPNNPKQETEANEEVAFSGETDRIYTEAPSEVVLNVGTGAGVQIQNENWSDCVVWNPWTSMEACYKEFVCVENAKTSERVKLEPNQSWRARADFEVKDLI